MTSSYREVKSSKSSSYSDKITARRMESIQGILHFWVRVSTSFELPTVRVSASQLYME